MLCNITEQVVLCLTYIGLEPMLIGQKLQYFGKRVRHKLSRLSLDILFVYQLLKWLKNIWSFFFKKYIMKVRCSFLHLTHLLLKLFPRMWIVPEGSDIVSLIQKNWGGNSIEQSYKSKYASILFEISPTLYTMPGSTTECM